MDNQYSRAHIQLTTQSEIVSFIKDMENNEDHYMIEDFHGCQRINARSMLGVLFASTEFDQMYLVNESHQEIAPAFNKYRKIK